jgi:ELWxxDGT repeat protein
MTSTSDQQLALQAQQPTAPVAPGLSVPSYTSSSSAPNIAPPAPTPKVGYDVNQDGKADLLWRNYGVGRTIAWEMNGSTYSNTTDINPVVTDPNWKLQATGDFTGDGREDDLIWRNYETGQNALWQMNGTIIVSTTADFPVVDDPTWRIEGADDFNGDGKTDILWRHYATGRNVAWLMNGTKLLDVKDINQNPEVSWKPTGTGDFNGDGQADIVWRNYANGANAIWLMNGTTLLDVQYTTAVEDTKWIMAGTGDYNGDGQTDLVWRNYTTGQNAIWLMNGIKLSGLEYPSTVSDLNWEIGLNNGVLDNANNKLAYARDITVGPTTSTYSDWVGSSDRNDYYKFTLGAGGSFNLALSDLGANADVQLLDSNGTAIAGSGNAGTANESIARSLAAGTYYIRVLPGPDQNTHYNLSVSTSNLILLNKNSSLGVDEGAGGTISNTQLSVSEPGKTAGQLTYKVFSGVTQGSLLKSNIALAKDSTFTQDDIDKGLVTYKHNGSETTSDNFSFTVSDGGSGAIGYTTFNFNVKPVNDIPAVNMNPGISLNEGATVTINPINLKVTDPDNTPAQLLYTIGAGGPVNGKLLNNGKALAQGQTFTQADIDNKLLAYQHDGGETTSDSFNFTVSDGAGGTVGNTTFKFNVVPVNDIPAVNMNPGMSLKEGETGTINTINLKVTDPDNTPAQLIYTLGTGGLANGTLLNSGKAVVAGGTFTQADIDNKLLSYQHNGSETTSDSFNFTVSDGVGGTVGNTNFKFNVIPVNDAPVLDNSGSPVLTTIKQNQPLNTNTGTLVADIIGDSISDVDITPAPVEGVAITAADNANGSWEFSVDNGASWTAVGPVSVSSSRLVATNAKLRFVPKPDFAGDATITFRAWDQTSGINGGTADTSVNGGITAFSTAVEIATITVKRELSLTKVINPGSKSSLPQQLTVAGNYMYFTANGTTTDAKGVSQNVGIELWRSDGTAAGTSLVKDIFAGASTTGVPNNSSPDNLTNVGGTLYFTADDGVSGRELWRTDGNTAGTVMVKDIRAGGTGSAPTNLTAVGNKLFFTVNDGTNGLELWASDGTTTAMVADISPGSGSSSPDNLIAFNNKLYFTANTAAGNELWTSDGTAGGTKMVQDIYSGVAGSNPTNLTVAGNRLFFTAGNQTEGTELWQTDGISAAIVKDINPGINSSTPLYLTAVGSKVYFSANNGTNAAELWASDGSTGGTVMVKDINTTPSSSGTLDSSPNNLVNVNGVLYFVANDGIKGNELWRSDGTAAGTVMVKDINVVAGGTTGNTLGSNPNNLTNVNGVLYFVADNDVNGPELWTSNGIAAGTTIVKDIVLGANSSSPTNLTNFNNTLYFTANNQINGVELWKSTGTTAGTVLLKDVNEGSTGAAADFLAAGSNNTLYFTATDKTFGNELWKTDGSLQGTNMVKDIVPGLGSSSPSLMTNVNGTVYFVADNTTKDTGGNTIGNGLELWKTDSMGTTTLVKDIVVGTGSSDPADLINFNGTLYFTATNAANGLELWKSDGTTNGTVLVKDIIAGTGSSSPTNLTVVGNTLYFTASDGTNGFELWRSDGTTLGTVRVTDINPGAGSSSPENLTVVGSTLYFTATNATNGRELWKTGPGGTFIVKDIIAGAVSSSPANLTVVGTTLYFTASDGNGTKLWQTDGTGAGTSIVAMSGTSPTNLAAVGNILYFTATDATNGRELWQTTGGTTPTLVKDLRVGSLNSNPDQLTNVNGTLYFTANGTIEDPVTKQPVLSGTELWKIDGIKGPVIVKDLNPGVLGSNPDQLTNVNGTLYFIANDGVNGDQIWTI